MKRTALLILALVLCLSFCACDGSRNADSADTFTKPDNYATVVLVTINPQVRLYIDRDGTVLAVEPVNKDAKKLVKHMEFEDKSYEEVVSEFVTAANADGFVKEDAQIEIEIVESSSEQTDTAQILNNASESAQAAAEELQVTVVVVRKPQQENKPSNNGNPNNQHEHTFTPATCQEPATCTTCGAMKGSAKGHDWEDPTCTTTKYCKICGERSGSSNGHNWRPASCTDPKTCETCGATDGEPKGHKWKDATCTKPKTCKTCDATEGDAKGHIYISGTCTVCGSPQENYKPLEFGVWTGVQVVNGRLYKLRLSFKDSDFNCSYGNNIHSSTFDPAFRDQLLQDYAQGMKVLTVVDGVYYYAGMGDGGPITYTVDGDSVQVNCDGFIHLSIVRTGADQLTVTASDLLGDPSGIILTWSEN